MPLLVARAMLGMVLDEEEVIGERAEDQNVVSGGMWRAVFCAPGSLVRLGGGHRGIDRESIGKGIRGRVRKVRRRER